MGVVADRIALTGLRLEREAGVELVQPPRLSRRENHVRKNTARTGFLIQLLARFRHLLIGQEPILLDIRGRRRDERDLGVAVEEYLLLVIVELQVLDGLFALGQLL